MESTRERVLLVRVRLVLAVLPSSPSRTGSIGAGGAGSRRDGPRVCCCGLEDRAERGEAG